MSIFVMENPVGRRWAAMQLVGRGLALLKSSGLPSLLAVSIAVTGLYWLEVPHRFWPLIVFLLGSPWLLFGMILLGSSVRAFLPQAWVFDERGIKLREVWLYTGYIPKRWVSAWELHPIKQLSGYHHLRLTTSSWSRGPRWLHGRWHHDIVLPPEAPLESVRSYLADVGRNAKASEPFARADERHDLPG